MSVSWPAQGPWHVPKSPAQCRTGVHLHTELHMTGPCTARVHSSEKIAAARENKDCIVLMKAIVESYARWLLSYADCQCRDLSCSTPWDASLWPISELRWPGSTSLGRRLTARRIIIAYNPAIYPETGQPLKTLDAVPTVVHLSRLVATAPIEAVFVMENTTHQTTMMTFSKIAQGIVLVS